MKHTLVHIQNLHLRLHKKKIKFVLHFLARLLTFILIKAIV